MKMKIVEGGSFKRDTSLITLSSFEIGKYPVKQKQYKKIMGVTPSYFKGKKHPVEQVSWYDTIKFCNERSRKEGLPIYYKITEKGVIIKGGKGFRLPTEAEWEYAARGGSESKNYKYSGSDNLEEVAWYEGNSGSETHPIGLKLPNELGLYDMSGNVQEWCWDWKGSYGSGSLTDPQGPSSGFGRVHRGGSWDGYVNHCRVVYRERSSPGFLNDYLGFRVARSI